MLKRTPGPSSSAKAVSRPLQARTAKFFNEPVEIDGKRFASKAEGARYMGLYVAQKMGEITALRCQPRYRLEVNGAKVCDYVGDFEYVDASTGRTVVEDVKSPATRKLPTYRLKVKLMKACLGIEVQEV